VASTQAAFTGELYKGVYVNKGKSINDIAVTKADIAFSKDPAGLCWINMDPG